MARVTVEDCIDKIENRFELVLLASHRSRLISSGAEITVERDQDKNSVVALREIAEETFTPEDLKEELIHSLQRYVEVDEPEDDLELTNMDSEEFDNPMMPNEETSFDQISEEDLLRGIEGLTPPDRRDD